MKRLYTFFIGLIFLLGFEAVSTAQSLVVSGTLFLPQDSIYFDYEFDNLSVDSSDWIGIYHIEDAPGGPASVVWSYLDAVAGSIYLDAPQDEGFYRAFIFCCDGYDTIAISTDFQVVLPLLEPSSKTYTQGDSIVLSYLSPRFSDTDWIGIYPTGTKPGDTNPAIDWDYIPESAGSITFKTELVPGVYDAYLLCCDGYDSISGCTFEVISANTPYIAAKSATMAAGLPIEIMYNDPNFAADDWIGIYFEGDDPAIVSSIAWAKVENRSGTVTFPGTLSGGSYYAILFCCNSSETIYAESAPFTIEAGASGTYVKTAASVYPENVNIVVNFRNPDVQENDWVGIYFKGDAPGSGPESIDWAYTEGDSGTIEFSTVLAPGNYVVYLLCCDGYQIKAKYDFQVADASTPSIVASSLTFASTDSLSFYYNSPAWTDTDWIGIYNPGDVPGEINSITWFYLPEASGTMVFSYPDNHELEPGEYWAGLFCCDGYDLYAKTSFIITEAPNSVGNTATGPGLRIYPNPSSGMVTIRVAEGEGLKDVSIFNLAGQLVHMEQLEGMVNEKVLDLGFLTKGMYLVSSRTDRTISTGLLLMQ